MAYEVLARKWRPKVFEEVIGQEHVTQTLMNAIKSGRLAHSYLFGGPRGVGKTSVARILAKAMNCEQGKPGVPCNTCRSCEEITEGSSVDVQEIDGASNRGIDEIRGLRDSIKYMPSASRYRIYIIDEVHMLTLPAFNALLKTLEEPPSHVKFIFATTESHKVPVTILSRCQRFDFRRIPLAKIIGHLEKMTKEEGIEISKSSLAFIAREAEGSMRDAQSLLDQVVSFSGPKVQDQHVIDILGVIDKDIILSASRAIIEGSPKKCLEIVDKIYTLGYDIKEFYHALMGQFRNLFICLISPSDNLLDMTETERSESETLAKQVGSEKLQILMNFMIRREGDIRFSSQPRLILETTMIKLCHLGDYLSFGDLLEKVESLERRLAEGTVTQDRTLSDRASESGIGWNRKEKGIEKKDASKVAQDDKSWDGFLNFLSTKNGVMFHVLKDWRVLKMSGNMLKIEKSARTFSSTYFDDPESLSQLNDYCREFFEKEIRVEIMENGPPASPTETEPEAEKMDSRKEKYSNISEPVQDILEVFQGEIEKEKSAKSTSDESSQLEEEISGGIKK